MLRFISALLLLSSCSLGVLTTGGERSYAYNSQKEYSPKELSELAPEVVKTEQRDPQKGKLEELFSKKQPPLKRIGIFVFESVLQPTRGGLSGQDKVYLSAQGKQLLAEKLLSVWEQTLPVLGPEFEYISTSKIKKSPSFKKYGSDVEDHIKAKRSGLEPDDIFFLPPGKNTTSASTLSARGMRDHSLLLIPAGELLQGPKFSEHAKHAINDLARELNLDAFLIVLNNVSWTSSHIDKHSGIIVPEELTIKIEATTLIPLHKYHERLKASGERRDFPKISVSYRAYNTSLQVPVNLSVEPSQENFGTIEKELLNPMLKTYSDATQMTLSRILADLKATH
jgi:hypothetical protein